ncbi:MAG: hypothetical protein GY913_26495 [Proteobacteria bacterium]|nr:hypothetical protein [Pseudomonadota bacterium]
MSSIIDALLASGRKGGVASLAIAAALGAVTAIDYVSTNGFFIALPALALAFVGVGVLLLVFGNPEDGEFKLKERSPLDPAFEDRLVNTPKPYFVCTDCRCICEIGQCDECGKGSNTVPIHDDEDLRLARTAMS